MLSGTVLMDGPEKIQVVFTAQDEIKDYQHADEY